MDHHFSFDPRMVLGVHAEATPEEIHKAFVSKSKIYHPDHGGDEWAFKMVARAYEILKVTREIGQRPVSSARPAPAQGPGPVPDVSREAHASPQPQLRKIDAELVWIRCEGSPRDDSAADQTRAAMTLSVCLVVSWPQAALINRAADLPESAEILRLLIQTFDRLKAQPTVIDFRSRIEDGQFVGWLSFPSVLQVEDAFHAFRDELAIHELGIRLRTRDEQVPIDWVET